MATAIAPSSPPKHTALTAAVAQFGPEKLSVEGASGIISWSEDWGFADSAATHGQGVGDISAASSAVDDDRVEIQLGQFRAGSGDSRDCGGQFAECIGVQWRSGAGLQRCPAAQLRHGCPDLLCAGGGGQELDIAESLGLAAATADGQENA